jgi:hypothetical protein
MEESERLYDYDGHRVGQIVRAPVVTSTGQRTIAFSVSIGFHSAAHRRVRVATLVGGGGIVQSSRIKNTPRDTRVVLTGATFTQRAVAAAIGAEFIDEGLHSRSD